MEIGGLRTWNHLEARMVGSLRQKEARGNVEEEEGEGESWVLLLIRNPPKAEHFPLKADLWRKLHKHTHEMGIRGCGSS